MPHPPGPLKSKIQIFWNKEIDKVLDSYENIPEALYLWGPTHIVIEDGNFKNSDLLFVKNLIEDPEEYKFYESNVIETLKEYSNSNIKLSVLYDLQKPYYSAGKISDNDYFNGNLVIPEIIDKFVEEYKEKTVKLMDDLLTIPEEFRINFDWDWETK